MRYPRDRIGRVRLVTTQQSGVDRVAEQATDGCNTRPFSGGTAARPKVAPSAPTTSGRCPRAATTRKVMASSTRSRRQLRAPSVGICAELLQKAVFRRARAGQFEFKISL